MGLFSLDTVERERQGGVFHPQRQQYLVLDTKAALTAIFGILIRDGVGGGGGACKCGDLDPGQRVGPGAYEVGDLRERVTDDKRRPKGGYKGEPNKKFNKKSL